MSERSESINPQMSGEELRLSWQGRALAFCHDGSHGQLSAALLSLLADNYDETLPFLLCAVFGEVIGIAAPFYCSNPKIDKAGRVVADMIDKHGRKIHGSVIFANEDQMQGVLRRLADRLRLSDAERIDLFIAARHWVKADWRLDPTMDRRDPEAKRLVVH